MLSLPMFVGVFSTRHEDSSRSLGARGRFSKKVKAPFVMSIHINSLPSDVTVRGFEVYCKPDDPVAYEVAKHMTKLAEVTYGKTRVFKTNPDNWLKRAHNVLKVHEAPAVLVECGYATNSHDLAILESKWEFEKLVTVLRSGVLHALSIISGE
jgi:N-acetylmuramoyl-L-alanine amidase